ncbi:hypothetical protein Goari_019002 [Gossypium aridum]|uniref:F-box domain-containing protein n=1 Tax=Gossypium aridum TaxID=34290 RepID=A0A7J8WRN6_GOSAI|nr:hypothetical protein [Gossypium aridum]
MGKESPIDRESKTARKNKRLRSSSSKYLKPGTLAHLRYNKASASKFCTDLGKKRVAVDTKKAEDDNVLMENKVIEESPLMLSPVNFHKQNGLVRTPKTPRPENFESESRLESLPMDLLVFICTLLLISLYYMALKCFTASSIYIVMIMVVYRFYLTLQDTMDACLYSFCTKEHCNQNLDFQRSSLSPLKTDSNLFLFGNIKVKILCHLHHDQLRAVFHVSQRIRKAVSQARQFHFNFTTPDRSRQEVLSTMTPRPTDHWPFMSKGEGKGIMLKSPHTPKAPRHGPRPPSRVKVTELRQIAAVLFQDSAFPSRCMVPSTLPKPLCKSLASNRVLFYEDELCQAVAQNKLR